VRSFTADPTPESGAYLEGSGAAKNASLPNKPSSAPAAQENTTPSGPSTRSPKGPRGRGGRKPRPPRANQDGQTSPRGQTTTTQAEPKQLDDDGFEVKVIKRSAPTPPRGGGQGVRGSTRGSGSTRGRGARGGRGGATADRPRAASGAAEKPREGATAAPAAKPKPSIYKSVQPSGPKSAPVIS
jgi:hypothetical protein